MSWVVNGVRRAGRQRGGGPGLAGKLIIRQLRLQDAGVYQCFAENTVATVFDAVKVISSNHCSKIIL